jgi:hypothetical protein
MIVSLCSMTSSVSLSPTIVAPSARVPALSFPIHLGLHLARSRENRKMMVPPWRLQTHLHHTSSVYRSQSSLLWIRTKRFNQDVSSKERWVTIPYVYIRLSLLISAPTQKIEKCPTFAKALWEYSFCSLLFTLLMICVDLLMVTIIHRHFY